MCIRDSSYAFQQCQNFENRLRFDKVTESLKVRTFLRHNLVFVNWNITSSTLEYTPKAGPICFYGDDRRQSRDSIGCRIRRIFVSLRVTALILVDKTAIDITSLVWCCTGDYTPRSRKKQPLCFLVITSANEHRFSQFFHCEISPEIFYRPVIETSTSP